MNHSSGLGIIFSRDRALQLDGLLRSLSLHCHDRSAICLFVLYRATNEQHSRQYLLLADQHTTDTSIIFFQERKFRRDVLKLLQIGAANSAKGILRPWLPALLRRRGLLRHVGKSLDPSACFLFLVDDSICVRSFSLQDVRDTLSAQPDALGFSLRLGSNITYSYPYDTSQVLPPFAYLPNRMIKYNWTSAEGDFGYPLELSSSVYRLNDLCPLLKRLQFSNPNTLEARMAAQAEFVRPAFPYLLCYEQSVTFSNPVNKVQLQYPNRAGVKEEYTSEHLAQMFDEGYRIQVEAYSGFVPSACHQETELILTRP